MKIKNPLQMNDWKISNFLSIVLAVQLLMWGSIGLDFIGFHIPILRQLIGFIYLSFVPGILIIRVLRLHNMDNIEVLLFSIGLSLSILMFISFLINFVFSVFSATYLVISLSLISTILCFFCYLRDDNFSEPTYIDLDEIFSVPVLFLCLVPFLSVFGTYLVNFRNSNLILMLMIIIIAILALLIGFDKFIPSKYYPLTIWIMAISLIWHNTLISSYINVGDLVEEYSFSDLVVKNLYWDWTLKGNYNSALSIVALAPIFHHICNLSLTWIFKIIYPFLFSFVSLGIYYIFLQETQNTKISFLSSFLFISVTPFFNEVPFITKQSTAEFFLVLLLILITDTKINNKINKVNRSIFSLIFTISLIVSHYGTSYIVMFLLIFTFLFLSIIKNQRIEKVVETHFPSFSEKNIGVTHLRVEKNSAISLNFLLIFITFTLSWFIYISGSSVFSTITHLGEHIVNTIWTDFLSPDSSRGLYLITRNEVSLLRTMNKIWYFITQFFIIIGFLKVIKNYNMSKISPVYICVSIFFLIILFSAIAISGFAVMDPARLFHLSLMILSPFSVIGGLAISKLFFNFFADKESFICTRYSLNLLSVFFVIFLLFNTGFLYEIAKDHPNSISISQKTIQQNGNIADKARFYGQYIVSQNVFSGNWLGEHMSKNLKVYRGDLTQGYPSLTIYGHVNRKSIINFDNNTKKIGKGYVQISYLNLIEDVGFNFDNDLQIKKPYVFSSVYPLLEDKKRIYDNGGSEILLN